MACKANKKARKTFRTFFRAFSMMQEHFTKLLYMFHFCLRHLAEDKLPEGINDLWHGNTSYPLLSFWQHTLHDLP
jgi:hypothetical protein